MARSGASRLAPKQPYRGSSGGAAGSGDTPRGRGRPPEKERKKSASKDPVKIKIECTKLSGISVDETLIMQGVAEKRKANQKGIWNEFFQKGKTNEEPVDLTGLGVAGKRDETVNGAAEPRPEEEGLKDGLGTSRGKAQERDCGRSREREEPMEIEQEPRGNKAGGGNEEKAGESGKGESTPTLVSPEKKGNSEGSNKCQSGSTEERGCLDEGTGRDEVQGEEMWMEQDSPGKRNSEETKGIGEDKWEERTKRTKTGMSTKECTVGDSGGDNLEVEGKDTEEDQESLDGEDDEEEEYDIGMLVGRNHGNRQEGEEDAGGRREEEGKSKGVIKGNTGGDRGDRSWKKAGKDKSVNQERVRVPSTKGTAPSLGQREGGPGSGVREQLKRRGKSTTEPSDKFRLDLKVKIYDHRSRRLSPRDKMMAMLRALKEEDPSAMLECAQNRIQEETEFPAGDAFREAFKLNRDKEGNEYLHMALLTKKKLRDLKWNSEGRLMKWLTEERVLIKQDRWRTAKTRTVGFLVKVHPTLTWKPDLRWELRQQLKETTGITFEKEAWLRSRGGGEEYEVPEFELVHEKKGFGTGKGRVFTTVVNIETRIEDSRYLKALLRQAMSQQTMDQIFIEAGYHLTTSSKRLIAMLNMQNKYLNESRAIPVVGISNKVMQKEVLRGEKWTSVKEHLKARFQLEAVERTSQSQHLGKWFFITNSQRHKDTVRQLDTNLHGFFEDTIDEGERIAGFAYPRRTNGPTVDERHEDYLAQVEICTGVGSEVDSMEVEITKETGRRRMTQYVQSEENDSKKLRKTYAQTAGGRESERVVPREEKAQTEKGKATPSGDWRKSFEERSAELDRKFEVRMEEQDKQIQDLYLRAKEESQQRLGDALESYKKEVTKQIDSLLGELEENTTRKVREIVDTSQKKVTNDMLTRIESLERNTARILHEEQKVTENRFAKLEGMLMEALGSKGKGTTVGSGKRRPRSTSRTRALLRAREKGDRSNSRHQEIDSDEGEGSQERK